MSVISTYPSAADQPADLTTQMLMGVPYEAHEYVLGIVLALALLWFVPAIIRQHHRRHR